MRHSGGRPRPRKMTMVEWLVVMAILGVFAATLLPAVMQSARRAQRETRPVSSALPDVGPREGQDNVIEVPAAHSPPQENPPRPRGPGLGGAVSLVIWIAALMAVWRAMRRATAIWPARRDEFENKDDAD